MQNLRKRHWSRRIHQSIPRAFLGHWENRIPVVSKESEHTTNPDAPLAVFRKALNRTAVESVLPIEIAEGLAVIAIHSRVFNWKPVVARSIQIQFSRLGADNAISLGEMLE
jgi:hypothetical protein